jgi:hypothetical protein
MMCSLRVVKYIGIDCVKGGNSAVITTATRTIEIRGVLAGVLDALSTDPKRTFGREQCRANDGYYLNYSIYRRRYRRMR